MPAVQRTTKDSVVLDNREVAVVIHEGHVTRQPDRIHRKCIRDVT